MCWANETIEMLKTCLVTWGFEQKNGFGYDDAFAPIMKSASIRFILTLITNNEWIFFHFIVSTTFLNGKLKEKFYMTQLDGFVKKKVSLIVECKKNLWVETSSKSLIHQNKCLFQISKFV
jgi:hypothetical protein